MKVRVKDSFSNDYNGTFDESSYRIPLVENGCEFLAKVTTLFNVSTNIFESALSSLKQKTLNIML